MDTHMFVQKLLRTLLHLVEFAVAFLVAHVAITYFHIDGVNQVIAGFVVGGLAKFGRESFGDYVNQGK